MLTRECSVLELQVQDFCCSGVSGAWKRCNTIIEDTLGILKSSGVESINSQSAAWQNLKEVARMVAFLAGDGASYLTVKQRHGRLRKLCTKHWAMNKFR